jgi:hypothetical protein
MKPVDPLPGYPKGFEYFSVLNKMTIHQEVQIGNGIKSQDFINKLSYIVYFLSYWYLPPLTTHFVGHILFYKVFSGYLQEFYTNADNFLIQSMIKVP